MSAHFGFCSECGKEVLELKSQMFPPRVEGGWPYRQAWFEPCGHVYNDSDTSTGVQLIGSTHPDLQRYYEGRPESET